MIGTHAVGLAVDDQGGTGGVQLHHCAGDATKGTQLDNACTDLNLHSVATAGTGVLGFCHSLIIPSHRRAVTAAYRYNGFT